MVYSISDDDSDEVMAIDDNSFTLSKCKKISPKRKSSENNVSSKKRRNEADLSDDFVVDILDDDDLKLARQENDGEAGKQDQRGPRPGTARIQLQQAGQFGRCRGALE